VTSGIGIEIDPDTIRAVRVDGRRGRRRRVMEAAWNPDAPADAVQALRATLGPARRVGVAVRLPLLFSKRAKLPPLSAAQRREVLRLEPQRYFPIPLQELAVAVRHDDLVFAAREASLAAWVRALEQLGPVDLVEPGPVALARALAEAGVRDGIVLIDDAERDVSVVLLEGGKVAAVRRPYGGIEPGVVALGAQEGHEHRIYLTPWNEVRAVELAAACPGWSVAPLPDLGTVPAPYLSAYGAAVGRSADLDATLAPEELRKSIVARRRRAIGLAAAAALSAAIFAAGSLEAWRSRQVERVDAELREVQEKAAPVLALQGELAALRRRVQSIGATAATRPDPLRALTVVSARLPTGAYIRSLRLSGGEWHIEGMARQAAAVTRALADAPEITDVRVIAATNRAQIEGEANESFALAFRLAARP
jgi:Tfp pilus assembly protein PilN